MSSKKPRNPSSRDSVFLGLLPVAYDLEAGKQGAIFRMVGAERIVKQRQTAISRQFADAQSGYRPISPEELKYRQAFCQRVHALADTTEGLDTQRLRAQAIRTINQLIDQALTHAQADNLDAPDRVNWVRVIGYLFQVSKSIMHEYDASSIETQLRELKRVVNNELERRKRERAEQAARSAH